MYETANANIETYIYVSTYLNDYSNLYTFSYSVYDV